MNDIDFTVKNTPNILTFVRIVLVPFICLLMYFDTKTTQILAFFFAFIASITDFFDGIVARKYNARSAFGRCMDPIADKVLVMALIIMLVYCKKAWVFSCIIILFREFIVSGLREFLAKEKQITIKVSQLSKVKTFIQMFSLLFLILVDVNSVSFFIGNAFLFFAAIISIMTSIDYIKLVQDYFK